MVSFSRVNVEMIILPHTRVPNVTISQMLRTCITWKFDGIAGLYDYPLSPSQVALLYSKVRSSNGAAGSSRTAQAALSTSPSESKSKLAPV